MNSKHRFLNLPLFILFFCLLLVIVGYNYWSYHCGYCTTRSLLSFSPPALVLLACNLLAGAYLLYLKVQKKRQTLKRSCACGAEMSTDWQFCPDCGARRTD